MSLAEQLEELPSVCALRAKGVVLDEDSLRVTRFAISGRFVRADHDHGGDEAMREHAWSVDVPASGMHEGQLADPSFDCLAEVSLAAEATLQ